MSRLVDSPFAQFAAARMVYAAGLREQAWRSVAEVVRRTGDPFVTAVAASWAIDLGRESEAESLISQLEEKDWCSAGIERLWLDYRTGRSLTGAIEGIVNEAFGRMRVDGGAHTPSVAECSRLSLVLGKALSDLGYLDEARDWLLRCMALSRRLGDLDSVAAASGALAEVLYLGGQPLSAFELLSVDNSLLTPGSIERDRLMVYRAHCLRELGEIDAARNLYAEARATAQLRGMPDSPWAARGLVWCIARESEGSEAADGVDRVAQLIEVCSAEPHCHGMALLALSWLHQHNRDTSAATACLERAWRLLRDNRFVLEAGLASGATPELQNVPWLAVVPEIGIDVCDEPFCSSVLVPRLERLRQAAKALQNGRDADHLTAAFF